MLTRYFTEQYSGVPARVQLVRNNENTILAFRNLLGKTCVYADRGTCGLPTNSSELQLR